MVFLIKIDLLMVRGMEVIHYDPVATKLKSWRSTCYKLKVETYFLYFKSQIGLRFQSQSIALLPLTSHALFSSSKQEKIFNWQKKCVRETHSTSSIIHVRFCSNGTLLLHQDV